MLYKDKILKYLIYFLGLFSSVGCLLFSFPFYNNPIDLYIITILILFIHSYLYTKNKKMFYVYTAILMIISLCFFYFGIIHYIDVVLTKYMQVSKYKFSLFNMYNLHNNLLLNVLTNITLLLPLNFLNITVFNSNKRILSIFVLFPLVFVEILFTITPPLLCIGGYILYSILLILQKRETKFKIIPIIVTLSMMISLLFIIPPDSYKHPRSKNNPPKVSYGTPSEGKNTYNLMNQGNRYYTNKVDLTVSNITGQSFKLRGNVYKFFSNNTWLQETAGISRDYQYASRVSYLTSVLNCSGYQIEVIDHYNSKIRYVPYFIWELPDNIKYYLSHFEGEGNGKYYMTIPNDKWNNYLNLNTNEKNNFSSNFDIQLPKLTLYNFDNIDATYTNETYNILSKFLVDNNLFDYSFRFESYLEPEYIAKIPTDQSYSHEPLEYIEKVKKVLFDNTKYSLQPGITPNNENFFDYFLNKNKKGYCVHYASTLALILRLSGIEANFVTGYQVNASRSKSGYTEVLDSDAHAWVEIYDPILGIIPIEATPASSSSNVDNNPSNNPITPNNPSNNDNDIITQRPNDIEVEEEFIISPYVYIVLAIVLIFITIYLQSRLRYKYRFNKLTPNQSVCLMYYHLLKLECDIEDDIHWLVKKAKFSQHSINIQEFNTMNNLYKGCIKNHYINCNILNKIILKIIYAYI